MDDFYRTSDFHEAIFLRVSGVQYLTTEWPPNERQAVFIFRQPPEGLIPAFAAGQDKNVRIVLDAAEFLRDELHRRDR